MKTSFKQHRKALAVICSGCLGGMVAADAVAQNTRRNDSQAYGTSSSAQRNQAGEVEQVRVTRASAFLGSDVLGSDNRKLGDIVDYYFDTGSSPHLAYVVIMTGGFLDLGGDRRAVPASAIEASGDSCRIDMASTDFWNVPVLPENGRRFLSDPQNRQRISQMFQQQASGTASAGSSSQGYANDARNQTATTTGGYGQSDPYGSSQDRADPNQAGAMTGRSNAQMTGRSGAQEHSRLVAFSELRNRDAYGREGSRLGFFADAWISLNDNRAPFVEITPTYQPFRTNYDRRYAIPTAKLQEPREGFGYTIDVTTDDLDKAEPVSETEGVRMLQEGFVGDAVLRVTVPETR